MAIRYGMVNGVKWDAVQPDRKYGEGVETHRCRRCGLTLPVECFPWRSCGDGTFKRTGTCMECTKRIRREGKQRSKEAR